MTAMGTVTPTAIAMLLSDFFPVGGGGEGVDVTLIGVGLDAGDADVDCERDAELVTGHGVSHCFLRPVLTYLLQAPESALPDSIC